MVEFNKRDIEAVANNRFSRSHWKHFVGYLGGLLVLTIVLARIVPNVAPNIVWVRAAIAAMPVLIMYIVGAIWWVRSTNKATRELLEDCKKAQALSFKEENA